MPKVMVAVEERRRSVPQYFASCFAGSGHICMRGQSRREGVGGEGGRVCEQKKQSLGCVVCVRGNFRKREGGLRFFYDDHHHVCEATWSRDIGREERGKSPRPAAARVTERGCNGYDAIRGQRLRANEGGQYLSAYGSRVENGEQFLTKTTLERRM